MHGRIDRIDEVTQGGVATLELIDYKTGSETRLRKQARERFEDTQLAFYAALVGATDERPLKATYLALEASPGLAEIEHEDVAASAAALVEGIAIDLRRLRGGAGLMPLGQGEACRFCEARGLCRRDHWLEEEPEGGAAGASRPFASTAARSRAPCSTRSPASRGKASSSRPVPDR